MQLKHLQTKDLCVTYMEAGSGPLVHFAHANGFSAGVYEPVFNALEGDFRVAGMNICGQDHCMVGKCAGDRRITSWNALSVELEDFITSISGGGSVVAVGHSIGGAVTLLCAARNPSLFKKIILLDPVLLDPKVVKTIRMAELTGQAHRSPLAQRAMKRRDTWASREEALGHFRDRPLFSGWTEESLRAYATHGLYDAGDGTVRLSCPKEVEAQGFMTYPTEIWERVGELRTPTVFVRGENSEVITPESRDLFLKLCPHAEHIEMPGAGHLFPMQFPAETAELIRRNARTAGDSTA
jgi:pimeloyl-ACP methyl ester carboxylesterase